MRKTFLALSLLGFALAAACQAAQPPFYSGACPWRAQDAGLCPLKNSSYGIALDPYSPG
jgi:hypothetical protein